MRIDLPVQIVQRKIELAAIMTRGLEDEWPKDLVEWEVNLGLRYALDIGWPSRHAEAFDAVFAVPFHRLPPREELPGEPERMGGKVDALVEGVDLSAGPASRRRGRSARRSGRGVGLMSPIGMAVIGTGYMGRTYAACLTRHVPDGRLISVWGGKRAPALAGEFGVEADESLADVLARPEVEAVVITSPHTAHRPQAEAAAAAGKHVYIEKPMSVSVADCDAIIAACDAAGVKLTVNFVTRFRHAPKAMKRLVDEGAIGDVRIIEMRGTWTGFLLEDIVDEATGRVIIPKKEWAWDPAEGSQFLDWGVHWNDVLRWFSGSEVARVYANTTRSARPRRWTSPHRSVTMANGVIAQC